MKEVLEMPEEGQFVVVYEFNNKVWDSTFRWEGGVLKMYQYEEIDVFTKAPLGWPNLNQTNIKYFVYE